MASAIKGKSGAAIIDGSALDQRSITPARELLNGEPSRGALKEGCPAKRRRYRTLPHLLGLGPSARGGPGGRPSPRQEAGPVISSERGRPFHPGKAATTSLGRLKRPLETKQRSWGEHHRLMWLIQKSPRPPLYVGAGVYGARKVSLLATEGSYRDIDPGVATMNNYKLQIKSYCDAQPSQ